MSLGHVVAEPMRMWPCPFHPRILERRADSLCNLEKRVCWNATPWSKQPPILMVKLTTCSTLFEAQVLVDELERAGIPAFVANQDLHGTAGGLYSAVPHIDVCIANTSDEKLARDVLEAHRDRGRSSDERTVRCPSCGEQNPDNFELCWSCRAELAAESAHEATTNSKKSSAERVRVDPSPVARFGGAMAGSIPGLIIARFMSPLLGLAVAFVGFVSLFMLLAPKPRFQCSACDAQVDARQERCHACSRPLAARGEGAMESGGPSSSGLGPWMIAALVLAALLLILGLLFAEDSDPNHHRIYPQKTRPF